MLASLPLAAGALAAARPFARAAVRYRIVAAGFLLAAAVGPAAFVAAVFRAAPAPGSGAVAPATAALTALTLPAAAIAAALAAALLCELAVDVVRLRRVKRAAAPLGSVAIRRARVGTSPRVATPTAIGYLHPAVVLPEGFRARVDASEWDAVIAHECAHLARRDDWAKALQSAIARAAWWLPGLWILGRALDLERELASDEHAAGQTGARRYAACLLRLATSRHDPDAVAPALWGRRSHVAIRVERLVRPVADGGPVARAAALGTFTAAAFAVVGVAVLAVPGTAAAPLHTHVAVARTVPQQASQRVAARVHPAARPVAHANALAYRRAADVAPHPPRFAPPALRPSREHRFIVAPIRPAPRRSVAAAAVGAPQLPSRRAPQIRPLAVERLAIVAMQRRCGTCFGPLRSPDDGGSAPGASFAPAAGLPSATASTIAVPDPTSGPVDLGSGLSWYRLPRAPGQ
jgi:beta-lactamase regulating signal transducer with metallopeptidase domain